MDLSEPIDVRCPGCSRTFRVTAPDEDQQAMCRACGSTFIIPAASAGRSRPVRRTRDQAATEYYLGESLASRLESVARAAPDGGRPPRLTLPTWGALLGGAFVAASIFVAWFLNAPSAVDQQPGQRASGLQSRTVAERAPVGGLLGPGELADFIESVEPSVVQIRTPRGVSSGFVIDPVGLIVTCWHCVDRAGSASVTLADGTALAVVGVRSRRRDCDLAVLEVSPSSELTPLALADKPPRKGERIVTFGSPAGLSFSVSEGRVSAVRTMRDVRDAAQLLRGGGRLNLSLDCDVIQFTANSMPGHSGGPIVDLRGNVLGVTSFGLPYQGRSFEFAISYVEIDELVRELDAVATPLAELRRKAPRG